MSVINPRFKFTAIQSQSGTPADVDPALQEDVETELREELKGDVFRKKDDFAVKGVEDKDDGSIDFEVYFNKEPDMDDLEEKFALILEKDIWKMSP